MFDKFRDKFLLETIVFFSGTVVMIYEIIGSRILAPYIGTSTYIWTSLIGVILGSLSVGYWFGGRLADRQPNSKLLAAILFAAAALVTVTLLVQEFFLLGLSMVALRLELKALIAALVLFAPASVLFGCVTPYAVRLKMIAVEDAGKTVGRLYSLSTIGSILGTFAAGFILLPFVGSVRTLYLIIVVLFALSLMLASFKITVKNLFVLLLFPVAVGANEFIGYPLAKNYEMRDFDTQYSRIRVWRGLQETNGRAVRVMAFDPYSVQSAMYLDSDELASNYAKFYHLLRHFKPDFQKTLIIGGAGYSFPKEYLRRYPNKQLDAVEIDPRVTQIARDYFRLEENANLRIFHGDGRIFLNQTRDKYDALLVDAYSSVYSVPFQLTTVEAVRKMNEALTDDGAVLLNMISAVEGDGSFFLQAEYKTFAEVFPHLYLFKVNPALADSTPQNVILVAAKTGNVSFESDDEEIAALLKNRYEKPLNLTVPALTDDLAPVEYYNSFAQKSAGRDSRRLKNKVSSMIKNVFGGN